MKLIVGLGNPGTKYSGNRHNIGFMALDAIAGRHGLGPWRKRFQALTAEGGIGGQRTVLMKPETYMNESGRAVSEAVRFLKIEPADVIVFHDELDLDPGRLKVKTGGGNAGHNGLRSISAHIGNDYLRVRLGIGHPGHKDLVSGYVLHDFAREDRTWLVPLLGALAEAMPLFVAGKPDAFLSEIARAAGPGGGAAERSAAVEQPSQTPPRQSDRHPSGDRAGKRESALAENLRKFLAKRDGGA